MEVMITPNVQRAQHGSTALAMGYFDGLHLGHRRVVQAALQDAAQHGLAPAVFTFTQGQAGAIKGRSILTNAQKHQALADMGVEVCFEPPFESFCTLTPQQFFFDKLLGEYGAKALFCGENFAFGAKRAGNPAFLRRLCEENGIALTIVPTALWQGQPVSSSRIREALAKGDMPSVNAMLGNCYEINFPVRHGERLGSTLGFPTLNQVFPDSMQPPKLGVYITEVCLGGICYPAATGFGTRPTVNSAGNPTCETFIPGFSGDLYGKCVQVRFHKRIANTTRFSSPQELAGAVQSWAKQATEYFKQGAVLK